MDERLVVGSVNRPADVLGDDFFRGAQADEGAMPVSIFMVSRESAAFASSDLFST